MPVCLCSAADAVSESDIYSDYIRSRQAWGLLPNMAIANVRAAGWAAGGVPPFMSFPTYLAKNSSRSKKARLLAELGLHMAAHTSGGRSAVRLDYLTTLRATLFAPLIKTTDAVAAAGKVSGLLDEYGLTRDDMMVTMAEELAFKTVAHAELPAGPEFVDYTKVVDAKTKAAFTREYNKTAHRTQVFGGLPPGAAAAFTGRKRAAPRGGGGLGIEGEDEEDEDEDDEGGGGGGGGDDEEEDEEARERKESEAIRKAIAGRGGRGRGRGRGGSAASRGGRGGKAAGAGAGAGAGARKPAAKKASAAAKRMDSDDDDDDDWDDDE